MAVTILKEELQSFHFIGILSILLGVNFPLIAHFFAYKRKTYNSKEEELLDNNNWKNTYTTVILWLGKYSFIITWSGNI